MMRRGVQALGQFAPILGALVLFLGCGSGAEKPTALPEIQVPPEFPAFTAPEDNEPTPERIALGRRLFYDGRLSRTKDVACATCHVQHHAFADPAPVSTGVEGRTGTRNAPALVNLAWGTSFFWHGGASSLEVQAVGPIKNPLEMDFTLAEIITRLEADAPLLQEFDAAYGEGPTESTIPRALASFVRSLISGDSACDRFLAGDTQAMSKSARRGEAIFNGEKGECFHCHSGFNLTNNGFKNDGSAPDDPDQGRFEITQKASDIAKFKVPTLRNVAVSPPYMHDGSLLTLEDVIDAYVAGGRGNANTDPTIHPLDLSTSEKADLLAFLEALTDEAFLKNPNFAKPE